MNDSNIAVVIPALDENRYYPDGDLVRFWDTTLLEWKISQVLGFTEKENIVISTPSEKVISLAKEYGLRYFKRDREADLSKWVLESVEAAEREIILWTHATSPFISAGDYQAMLEKYFSLPESKDGLIAVHKEQEYTFFRNEPLNFDFANFQTRKNIEPVYRMTNGCFITSKENYRRGWKFFGEFPSYYEVDKLTALEIKDVDHYEIATTLLSMYFKVKEI